MNTKLVNCAADVITRAMETGRQTPAGWAMALESAQLLQSPETAAELARLRARVAELEAERHSTNESLSEAAEALRRQRDRISGLEARLAEFERPVDEDPIAYELTEQAEVFVPRTERERWVDIANALNAAHAAGMPVGIDLDGTLTDGRMWSVVWDRGAERWTVAGYDDGQPEPEPEPDVTPQVRKLRDLLAGQRDAVAAEAGDAR